MKRGKKLVRGRCGCGNPAMLSYFGIKFCDKCWTKFWKIRCELKYWRRIKDGKT
jgi:hypothetical protein